MPQVITAQMADPFVVYKELNFGIAGALW